jgi:hypothetical protein
MSCVPAPAESSSTTSHSRVVSWLCSGRQPLSGNRRRLSRDAHAQRARHDGLAVCHLREDARQARDASILGQVADGAGAQDLEAKLVAGLGGEDDDARLRCVARDRPDRLDAAEARQLRLHHREIGAIEAHEVQCVAAVRGVGDDDEPRRTQRVAYDLAYERIGIGEHDAQPSVLGAAHRARPVLPLTADTVR